MTAASLIDEAVPGGSGDARRRPLRDAVLLPDQAQLPGRKYLDWHKADVFAA